MTPLERPLNVFIIPSWYPNRYSFVAGIFFKEQAIAIGDLRPDWQIAVSLWNQGENDLPLRAPLTVLRHLKRYVAARRGKVRVLRPNVREYREPYLMVSERLKANVARNREALLEANRRNLRRAIADFGRVDVLHAHVSHPAGWIAMHLSQEFGIPYVLTEHMSPFPFQMYLETDGSLRDFIREPLVHADARLAVSPAHAEEIARFGVPKPQVVPNVVDERFFAPAAKRDGRSFTFFTLGFMVPQKGIPDLLEAIARLSKQAPDLPVAFRIGGDGPDLPQYQAQARQLGIEANVTWLGTLTREQARTEFQHCDGFVLPSRHESFGVVYAEATACGKPIIATRCGGPEFIVTPENGLLVDTESPDQLAEALLTLVTSGSRYDPAVIRAQFEERFSREAVVQQIEHVYREVLASQ